MKKLVFSLLVVFLYSFAHAQSILWQNTYNGGSTDETAIDVAVDANDNVFVLAQVWNGADYDQAIIKYNNQGTQQWVRTFNNSLSNKRDIPVELGVDNAGNVYSVVNTGNEAQNTAELIKYNALGTLQWSVNFGGAVGNTIKKLIVDGSGNCYVAGDGFQGGFAYLAKYNSSGTFQWSQTVDVTSGEETFNDIFLDEASGFIYASGKSGTRTILTAKYSTAGAEQWVHRQTLSSNGYFDAYGEQVVADGNGFVYTIGTSINDTNLGKKNYVLKYNSSGQLQASNEFSFHDDLTEAIVDQNRVYVATTDMVFRIAGNLTLQWSNNPPGLGYVGSLAARSDNTIVYGYGASSLDYRVYDLNGNILEESTATGVNLAGLALDSNDQPVVIGYDSDVYTVQFCETPVISLAASMSICEGSGEEIIATVSAGATVSWSPTTGLSDPNIPNPIVSQAGTYTMTATYANGCTASKPINVLENALPPKYFWVNGFGITSDEEVGYDPPSSISLNGQNNPDLMYSWFNLDDPGFNELTFGNVVLIVSSSGRYYAEVTNTNTGCQNTTYVATIKANQSITFDPIPDKERFDAPFELTASASSGLPVSYTIQNTDVASITGSTVTINGVGTTTITASQPGNSEYAAASIVQQTLTVNKAEQTITFGALNDIKYTDPPQDLTATSSSGLEVTYSSSDENIVVINNGQAHPTGVGTVTITASQSGNGDYNAAPDVLQSFTVLKGDQTISFDPIGGPYNVTQNGFAISADASSGLPVTFVSSDINVISISGSSVSINGAGTATITAQQSGDNLYNAAPDVSQEVTINKLSQTVTVPDLSANNYTYGLSASPFQVSNSSGIENMVFESSDEGIFTIQNISNQGGGFFYVTIEITGAGTATFTATQPGDETYEAASASTSITVNKSDQLIEFFSLSPVFFDDPDFELSATAESGLPVTFTSTDPTVASVSGTTVMIHNAGETTIIASQSGNANYHAAADVLQTLTVMPRTQTISFNTVMQANHTFGDGPFSFEAIASSGLPVTISIDNESVVTVENGIATIVGAGVATITATQSGNQNYVSKQSTFSLQVEKASQTITFDPLPAKVFGDPAFQLTATTTSGLPITYSSGNESVATIAGDLVTIVGAGSSLITASQPGNDNYYAAGNKIATLTVNKADQTIIFDPIADQEVGTSITLSATSSSGLSVAYQVSGPATLLGNQLTMDDLGLVTITASQSGNGNYNAAADVVRSFNIVESKLNQTITFDPLPTKTYGDEPFDLTATSSSGLAVSYTSSDLSVATISGATVTVVGAGTTTITASQSGDNAYHPAAEVAQVLTVNKASQTISFDLGTNAIKTFGDLPFSVSAVSSSGLPVTLTSSNSSVVSVDDGNLEIMGAGTATITASQSGNSNYEAAVPVDQTLTVNKAPQSVIFVPATLQDQLLSSGTVSIDVLGDPYAEGDLTVAIASGPATITNIGPDVYEVAFTGEGTVVVQASITATANYAAATDELSFDVIDDTKQNQSITFDPLPTKTYGDAPFDLTATASSGLQVSYSSSDESVATISGATVTIVGAGTTTITASQGGDNTYHPASDVSQVLTVNKAGQTISFELGTDAIKTFGDLPFSVSATSSSGLPVTLTSSNTSVVAVDNDNVEIMGAGTAVITATQPGDGNYEAAAPVDQTITVNKATQSVIFVPATLEDQLLSSGTVSIDVLGDPYSEGDLTVAIASGPATITNTGPDVYEIAFTGAGTVVVQANISETANYASATGELSFDIIDDSKSTQTITFDPIPAKTYGDSPFELSATASSGLVVSYTSSNDAVATISGSTVTIVGTGSATITASQSGDANYHPATDVSQELIVNKADQTITFDKIEGILSIGDVIELSASASSGLVVTFDVTGPAELNGNSLSILDQGTVTITALQSGDGNWNEATPVTQTVEITDAALGVSDNAILVYPNPFQNVLNLGHSQLVDVRIYSVSGSLVWSATQVKDQIDVSTLDEGLYILEIKTSDGIDRVRMQKIN